MKTNEPKVTVCAIIEKDGKVLLTKRNVEPFKDCWCLPGGHIDFGETAEDAVIREVKEETGTEFVPEFFDYFDEIIEKLNWHAVVLAFGGSAEGEIKKGEKEVSDIKWFSVDDAVKMDLAFTHNFILERWTKGSKNE